MDLAPLLLRQRWSIAAILAAGLAVGAILPSYLAPRFKASAVVSISPKYFQHPLVRDFMSETYDPGELRSQRDALVRQAFDQEFLDRLGRDLRLTREGESPLQAAERRQTLARAVEVVPLQATEYQISAIYGKREEALTIVRDGIDSLLAVMKGERRKLLGGLRDAVSRQLQDTLALGGEADGLSPSEEKASVESQLRFAQQTYSEAHPVVRRLRARLQQLRGEGALLANPESLPEGARKAAYGDLLRKLNYLNIALEMENAETPYYFAVVKSPELPTAPIWPRRPLIMVWSFFLSLLAAVALTFGRELFARSASPERGRAAEAAGPAWPAAFFHRAPAPAPLGEESESSDHGLFRN